MYSNPGKHHLRRDRVRTIAHHDPCASVQNLPGDAFVQPSALADAEALLNAKLEPDLEQLLTGVYTDRNPKAYAISAYSYLVTPEGQMNPGPGRVLGQFVEFLACQGQQSAQQLGYSPLPPNLVNDDFQGIKEDRRCGTTACDGQRADLQRPLRVPVRPFRSPVRGERWRWRRRWRQQ